MQRIYCATCALVLALAVAACGDSSNQVAQFSDGDNRQPVSEATSGTTASPATTPEDATRHLPDTASPLPLIGVIATLSLGGAFAIRFLRRA